MGEITPKPLLLIHCLKAFDDQAMYSMIERNSELISCRDENGITFADHAMRNNRFEVLRAALQTNPSMAWWPSQDVMRNLVESSMDDMIEPLIKEATGHMDPNHLDELSGLIPKLARNGYVNVLCHLLQAGPSDCKNGFTRTCTLHLNSCLNRQGPVRWFTEIFIDKMRPCNGMQMLPETSTSPSDLEMYGRCEKDQDERIALNSSRALLPNLSKKKILCALIGLDAYSSTDDIEEEKKPCWWPSI